MPIQITNIRSIDNHPYLRALIDLSLGGLTLRGLRLEENSKDVYALGFPGRKVQGRWQTVFEPENPRARDQLLQQILNQYQVLKAAA